MNHAVPIQTSEERREKREWDVLHRFIFSRLEQLPTSFCKWYQVKKPPKTYLRETGISLCFYVAQERKKIKKIKKIKWFAKINHGWTVGWPTFCSFLYCHGHVFDPGLYRFFDYFFLHDHTIANWSFSKCCCTEVQNSQLHCWYGPISANQASEGPVPQWQPALFLFILLSLHYHSSCLMIYFRIIQ